MQRLTGPTVDVVMSTYNEEAYIERCLDAVLEQDYAPERTRILLVDGGSTDRTVEIVRRRATSDNRFTVIADGRRLNLPEALNVALERSSGEFVAKIDAHGYPERDFVRRAVEAFADGPSDLACVGGRPTQHGETAFGSAAALARTSRFGVGASGYADDRSLAFVDTVQCGVYRRDALSRVGNFDPRMNYGEDEEVNWRLRQAGYRILVDERIRFQYFARPTWPALYRQYRNYGAARVAVMSKHREFMRIHHFVPALAVCTAVALAASAPFVPIARYVALGGIAAYGSLALFFAAAAAGPRDPALVGRVAAAFLALHCGYGVGMLRGLAVRTFSRS